MQVHLVNGIPRLVTVVVVTSAAVMSVTASSAGASTTSHARTAAHIAAAHSAATPATALKGKTKGSDHTPDGCNNYNFCEYNAGNGGNLCFQTRKDSPSWPSTPQQSCAYNNEGEYNRGSNAIIMYSGPDYAGCYYTLYSGHYLLYNADDKFQGPKGCKNTKLEYNLDSSKFL
jgi:hypothetical protein